MLWKKTYELNYFLICSAIILLLHSVLWFYTFLTFVVFHKQSVCVLSLEKRVLAKKCVGFRKQVMTLQIGRGLNHQNTKKGLHFMSELMCLVSDMRTRGSARWRWQADIWSMMTRAPSVTTLPAWTRWLTAAQCSCHSFPRSRRTFSSLCCPASSSRAASESYTPCHGQNDPQCVVVFLADWPRFVSPLFWAPVNTLKGWATLSTPTVAIPRAPASANPFVPAELLHVRTGEQLLPLVTVALGRCLHFFVAQCSQQPARQGRTTLPVFLKWLSSFISPPFDVSCVISV